MTCIEVGWVNERLGHQGLALGPCEGIVPLAHGDRVPMAPIARKKVPQIIKTFFGTRYDERVLGVVGVRKELDEAAVDKVED